MNKKIGKIIGFLGYYRVKIMLVVLLLLMITMVATSERALVFGLMYDNPLEMFKELRNPTLDEAYRFMYEDNTSERTYVKSTYMCWNFAMDTIGNARDLNIRCAYAVIPIDPPRDGYDQHAIVCFDTTDEGIVFFEPQNDRRIYPDEVLWIQW